MCLLNVDCVRVSVDRLDTNVPDRKEKEKKERGQYTRALHRNDNQRLLL